MPKTSHAQTEQSTHLTKKQLKAIRALEKELHRIDAIEADANDAFPHEEIAHPATPNPAPAYGSPAWHAWRNTESVRLYGDGSHEKLRHHGVPLHAPARNEAESLELNEDVLNGVALVLEILERDSLDRAFIMDSDTPENEPRPMFKQAHAAVLTRLARRSVELLSHELSRQKGKLEEVRHG